MVPLLSDFGQTMSVNLMQISRELDLYQTRRSYLCRLLDEGRIRPFVNVV